MNVFTRKIRGFRLIDLVGLSLLILIIVGVYLAKTIAGDQRADIAKVERQISAEQARIRMLQAEVAHLEQPGRIERLSVAYLKMEPVPANREALPEQLPALARAGEAPKAKAASIVAQMIDGSGGMPGVPPPPPAEAMPAKLAEATP